MPAVPPICLPGLALALSLVAPGCAPGPDFAGPDSEPPGDSGPAWGLGPQLDAIRPPGSQGPGGGVDGSPLDPIDPPACPLGAPPTTVFAEVQTCAGLFAANHAVDTMEISGQAWGDFDGDGWLDLFVTDVRGPNTLFRNLGDGTFEAAASTEPVALPDRSSSGATFVDFDNDGDKDLFVTNLGPDALFRNDDAMFVDVTTELGLGDDGQGETASWADYDGDGWLDLYVANWACTHCDWVDDVPEEATDRLYRNEGGTFVEVGAAVLGAANLTGRTFVAAWFDYDDDGDPDLYVSTDKGDTADEVAPGEHMNRNLLYRNDGLGCGEWCFTEIGRDVGADLRMDSMGIAVLDFDQDLDLDLVITDSGPTRVLENHGDLGFVEASLSTGIGAVPARWAWGIVPIDYDNDGYLDLYQADGFTRTDTPNWLIRNGGDGRFEDVSEDSGAWESGESTGVATADYDRDGRVDIVVGNRAGRPFQLFRSVARGGGWVRFRLDGGEAVNRDAVGARVTLHLDDGRSVVQEVAIGQSLGAGSDPALHFGLGEADIDHVDIRWPDGLEETLEEVEPNREHSISR